MTTTQTARRNGEPKAGPTEAGDREAMAEPAEGIEQRINARHAKKDYEGVRDEALNLAATLKQTQQHAHRLASHHKRIRSELQALTAPEHYAVPVTAVQSNGRLTAEVAGLGNPRMHLNVHPDVDPQDLVVGATAIVSRERNCILRVVSPSGRWSHVATFEKHLGSSGRILVRDAETLIAVDVAHDLRDIELKKGDLIGFDRDVSGIAYHRLEPPKREHLFDEDVEDDFSRLAGLDAPISRIKRIIDFRFRYRHLGEKYGLKTKCGILIEGAPGNGKTCIARSCASYARSLFPGQPCRFMHVAGSQDYSMWFGESERKLIERFEAIRSAAKDGLVFVFWDEVDAIAQIRGTEYTSRAPDRILDTFLGQMDGVVPLDNVVMLFATNRADTLDPGFLRAGRVDEKIEIPAPNRRATDAILRCYLDRGLPLADDTSDAMVAPAVSRLFAPNGDYAEVAEVKLSDGRCLPVAGRQLISGAMLENVVTMAAQAAAVRESETGQEGITSEDLVAVLESELAQAVSLLAPANIKNYIQSIPQDAQPIAVHHKLSPSQSTYTR